MKLKRLLISLTLALILTLSMVMPVSAAAAANISVTATPEYIAITNAPDTWLINSLTGTSVIAVDTVYWSNPLGDTTTPTVDGAGVVDGECRFTVTNTSTVAIDLTVLFPHHAAGDASTNSDSGENAAGSFGAKTYFTGQLVAGWVICKNAGSDVGKDALAATTNIKWGIQYESQSDAWTSGTPMTSTVNIAATPD